MFGYPIESPAQKYLFCLAFLIVFAVLAKNLVRGAIGREWMAIRDMDVAAEVIGIRPVYAKLTAFAVSSFIVGVAGGLWAFVYLGSWEPAAFSIDRSFQLLFMVIIGGLGSIMGSFFGAAFIVVLPIVLDNLPQLVRHPDRHGHGLAPDLHDLRLADRVLPDRRAARPGAPVVHGQGKAAPLALPALTRRTARFHQRTSRAHLWRQDMKSRSLALSMLLSGIALAAGLAAPAAFAQDKEQFFPVLPYRTGAYAPNGVPWANGYVDYLKLVNARGGINGVKIIFEECETGYATDKGVECYERLKGKHGGATLFQPLSTGITFALTDKAPGDKIPLVTVGYGLQRIAGRRRLQVELPDRRTPTGSPPTRSSRRSARRKAAWPS